MTEVPKPDAGLRDARRMAMFLGSRPRLVVHPILFAAAYVLNTALANEITPAGWIRPLAVAVLLAALLTVLGWAVTRNRWDGALLASLVVVAVVSPASLAWTWFTLRGALGPEPGTISMAVLVWAALGGISLYVVRRRRHRQPIRRPSAETMNVLSVAVLLAAVGSGLIAHPDAQLPRPVAAGRSTITQAPDGVEQPDIVLILLDGYPRNDVLQRRVGASDQAFLDGLRSRGFDVAGDSRSNYMHTSLTLASMFGMEYVDEIPGLKPLLGSGGRQLGALRDATENGQALSLLDGAGYEVLFSAPGWEHVTFRRAPDRLLDSGELTDLETSLLHQTWLLYLINAVTPNLFTDMLRDRIVHSFDTLDTFAAEQRDHPTFLFLHAPAPHLPLVLRADGSAARLPALLYAAIGREGLQMTDGEYADAWASELAYIDGRVLTGIDLLLSSEAGQDAVVIVMADHGYNFEVREDDPEARLGVLFAARTPGAPGLLEDAPTPVNLFPVIFNRYFGTSVRILPDRYFISDWRSPLQLGELDLPDGAGEP